MEVSSTENCSRSVALEQDYVHEVYERIGRDLLHAKDPLRNTVHTFLDNLDPGSLIADIGCGNGKHLRDTNNCFAVGADCSLIQTTLTRQCSKEVILGNNLKIPLRSELFDGVLSVGVIHHLATKERRIQALRELTRILRVGGRILIAVRSQDKQHSQDVLMPWYDIKPKKEQRWLDQDSGEYDLEENSDDDSISLPSTDEDDDPSDLTAKFFPPMSSANGRFGERQSRSLDDDLQSSKSVPNPHPLVPINACYDFVRKAIRRLSSVNSIDSEGSQTEKLQRGDSAVPPSPSTIQDQKLELMDIYSMTLSDSIQKLVHDNYIELLNIDEASGLSFHPPFKESSHEFFMLRKPEGDLASGQIYPQQRSKHRLIRSLSEIFKNMPHIWSSKEVKSCSDLKSQTLISDDSSNRRNKLKRSQTTATCNPTFDTYKRLESIGELEMTISEADKIVNDFLNSSMSSVETVKNRDLSLEFGIFNTLSQSDIANGNVANDEKSKVLDDSSAKGSSSIEVCSGLVNNKSFLREKLPILDSKELDTCVMGSSLGNDRSVMVPLRGLDDFNKSQLLRSEDIVNYCNENDTSVLQFDASFIPELNFSNEFEEEECSTQHNSAESSSKAQIDQCKTEKRTTLTNSENKTLKMQKLKTDQSNKENWYIGKQFSDMLIDPTILDSSGENTAKSCMVNDEIYCMKKPCTAESIFRVNCNRTKCSQPSSYAKISYFEEIISDTNNHTKKNQLDSESSIHNCFDGGLDSKFNFASEDSYKSQNKIPIRSHNRAQNSNGNCTNIYFSALKNSNIHRALLSSYKPLMKHSNALGPFYDVDVSDKENMENSSLTSYYSMPEIYDLSNYDQEYNIYRDTLTHRTNSDILGRKLKYQEEIQEKCRERIQGKVLSKPLTATKFETTESIVIANKAEECRNYYDRHCLHSDMSASESVHKISKYKYTDSDIETTNNDITKYATSNKNQFAEKFGNCRCRQSVSIELGNAAARKRTNSIDKINEMLHFNCVNCSKYDKIDVKESRKLSKPSVPSYVWGNEKTDNKLDNEAYSQSNVSRSVSENKFLKQESHIGMKYPTLPTTSELSIKNDRIISQLEKTIAPDDRAQGTLSSYPELDTKPPESERSGVNSPERKLDMAESPTSETIVCSTVVKCSANDEAGNIASKPHNGSEVTATLSQCVRLKTNSKSPWYHTVGTEMTKNEESESPTSLQQNTSLVEVGSLSPHNVNYSYGRVHEDGATVVMHRYHHLFDKDELSDLIENYISDLHVLDYFHEQSNWCIIAEKVRVWTI